MLGGLEHAGEINVVLENYSCDMEEVGKGSWQAGAAGHHEESCPRSSDHTLFFPTRSNLGSGYRYGRKLKTKNLNKISSSSSALN